MEEPKFTEYKFKQRRGIDDLWSLYAFHGNSQGDESQSNDIADFTAAKGWMSYTFDVEMTPEAIAKEVARRRADNENYIRNLYRQGKYGEEFEVILSLMPIPELDEPKIVTSPLESYRMEFIDFTNDTKTNNNE